MSLPLLVVCLVAPRAQRPGVLGKRCEEDHDGLVANAPSGQALAVKGALELSVEALGILTHAVEPLMPGPCRGSHSEVLGAVEADLGVRIRSEERLPSVMVGVSGAGK